MHKPGFKLVMGIVALAVSVVLVTSVSYAWYTLSTKADAGDIAIVFSGIKWPLEAGYETTEKATDENGDPLKDASGNDVYKIAWAKELNVSAYMRQLQLDTCVLRPISTYDLQNWYSAQYSVGGDVNGFEEREFSQVANQKPVIIDGQDNGTNCLVYFDLWVREANDGEQAKVKLSTVEPRVTSEGVVVFGDQLVEETVEGTFVLTKPSAAVNESGNETGKYACKTTVTESGDETVITYDMTDEDKNKDALNSIRIGFAALDENDQITSYFIYEPNADRHNSTAHYSYQDADNEEYAASGDDTRYILNDILNVEDGETVQDYESGTELVNVQAAAVQQYRSNVTLLATASNGERVKLTDAATGAEGQTYDLLYTYVPRKVTDNNNITTVELWKQQTVRQLGSDWDMEAVSQKNVNGNTDTIDSTCVKTFGQFIDEAPTLCTVTNGEAVKIRVFFWIEGQDVDCWNEIAGGSIIANLEFTGVEIADISQSGD